MPENRNTQGLKSDIQMDEWWSVSLCHSRRLAVLCCDGKLPRLWAYFKVKGATKLRGCFPHDSHCMRILGVQIWILCRFHFFLALNDISQTYPTPHDTKRDRERLWNRRNSLANFWVIQWRCLKTQMAWFGKMMFRPFSKGKQLVSVMGATPHVFRQKVRVIAKVQVISYIYTCIIYVHDINSNDLECLSNTWSGHG